MVFHSEGIEELQTVGIRGESGQKPEKIMFAGSDNTFTGSETYDDWVNNFETNDVTWSKTGIQSKYIAELTAVQANGSNVQSIGIRGTTTGSEALYISNESFIGLKNSTFNVQIEGEVVITRPE